MPLRYLNTEQRRGVHRPLGWPLRYAQRHTIVARCSSSAATCSTRGRDTASPSGRRRGASSLSPALAGNSTKSARDHGGWAFRAAVTRQHIPVLYGNRQGMANASSARVHSGPGRTEKPERLNYRRSSATVSIPWVSRQTRSTRICCCPRLWWEPLGPSANRQITQHADDYSRQESSRSY